METYADANLMGGVTEYTTPAEVLAEGASDAPDAITTLTTTITAETTRIAQC